MERQLPREKISSARMTPRGIVPSTTKAGPPQLLPTWYPWVAGDEAEKSSLCLPRSSGERRSVDGWIWGARARQNVEPSWLLPPDGQNEHAAGHGSWDRADATATVVRGAHKHVDDTVSKERKKNTGGRTARGTCIDLPSSVPQGHWRTRPSVWRSAGQRLAQKGKSDVTRFWQFGQYTVL